MPSTTRLACPAATIRSPAAAAFDFNFAPSTTDIAPGRDSAAAYRSSSWYVPPAANVDVVLGHVRQRPGVVEHADLRAIVASKSRTTLPRAKASASMTIAPVAASAAPSAGSGQFSQQAPRCQQSRGRQQVVSHPCAALRRAARRARTLRAPRCRQPPGAIRSSCCAARPPLGRGQRPLVPLGHDLVVLHRLGAFEDAGQRVVVRRRDRVELVVVAAGAAERQPQEGPADGVDLLVDDVHLHLHRVVFGQHLGPERREARWPSSRSNVAASSPVAAAGRRPVARARTGRRACRG